MHSISFNQLLHIIAFLRCQIHNHMISLTVFNLLWNWIVQLSSMGTATNDLLNQTVLIPESYTKLGDNISDLFYNESDLCFIENHQK